jgi:hypothetical protein
VNRSERELATDKLTSEVPLRLLGSLPYTVRDKHSVEYPSQACSCYHSFTVSFTRTLTHIPIPANKSNYFAILAWLVPWKTASSGRQKSLLFGLTWAELNGLVILGLRTSQSFKYFVFFH